MVSLRQVLRSPAYAAWFEFEDLIVETEGADLVAVDTYHGSVRWTIPRSLYQGLRRLGVSDRVAFPLMPVRALAEPARPAYDLAIVVVAGVFDFAVLRWLRPALERSAQVVALIVEAWPGQLRSRAVGLEPLQRLDRLYVGLQSGAVALEARLGRRVSYLGPAADVVKGAASADQPRAILAVNPGRRSAAQHDALRRLAEDERRPYVSDTTSVAKMDEHLQHRANYLHLLSHADLLVCNIAKFDRPDLTAGVRDVSGRVAEAIATGAVPIGQGAGDDRLAAAGLGGLRHLEWSLDGGYHELRRLLRNADLDGMRRSNVHLAARSGDWAHRIERLLGDAALRPSARTGDRLRTLESLASPRAAR